VALKISNRLVAGSLAVVTTAVYSDAHLTRNWNAQNRLGPGGVAL
jgi:hypothetical protein